MSGGRALRLDAGLALPGEPPLQIAGSLWLPDDPAAARALLVCLPGGNMNRRYFDLRPPAADDPAAAGDDSYSFAAQMSARGFAVAAFDHLGLGESSRPADGWQLTPQRLVAANAAATAALGAQLRAGRIDGLPRLDLRSIGVGHSMGGMLTVLQQHAARSHAAIALLGFSTRGLPEYLPPALREADPQALAPQLVALARQMFGEPYPVIHRGPGGASRDPGTHSELYGSREAEPRGVAALKAATDCLLPVPALLSMLPNNVAAQAAAIDVPVFLGIGERDMVGPPEAVPPVFAASPEVALCLLPGAGHSHFLFAARHLLFDRLARWAGALAH